MSAFNGIKVFSATMVQDRAVLGERVTEWLRNRSHLEVVDMVVTQSSDQAFHCIAITVFYKEEYGATKGRGPGSAQARGGASNDANAARVGKAPR